MELIICQNEMFLTIKILQKKLRSFKYPPSPETIYSHFCDLVGLKIKLRLRIGVIDPDIITMGRYKDAEFHSLQLRHCFHHNVIAQLHVYHPWHWRNVSFSESPHKTLIYKSLAEISPLAKLPSQAVDLLTQRLQSGAQHGTSLWEDIRGKKKEETEEGSLEYEG